MAAPREKLASSLAELKELQSGGRRVFRSKDFSRVHRERLVSNGFLRDVIKGWLVSSSPATAEGDTTPWYASFWEFCARYSEDRFGEAWHLSPEQSLLLHAESTVIPAQVIVYAPKGTNNTTQLPFGTSLYDLKQKEMPPAADLIVRDGMRLFTPAAALTRVPDSFFQRAPLEAQVALNAIKDASEVLGQLLDGGRSVIASRLAGAFRRADRSELADEIVRSMKSAGYVIRETDPFTAQQQMAQLNPGISPVVGRVRGLWMATRQTILDNFPKPPGLPKDKKAFLHSVDDIYKSDAYHSLSIEGYSVTPELIERVRSGSWSPETNKADKDNRDALAARGYWEAFQHVKASVTKIIGGENPGRVARVDHRDWYRALFQPSVAAGIIRPGALAGHRNHPVYIRGSRHVPPRWESLSDAMSALFDLIEEEKEPAVRAVLAHWLMGYIHPFPDGNGRMARFLMNAMLASGGYAWTIIRVDDRTAYLRALEAASIDLNLAPFSQLIAGRIGLTE